MEDIGDHENLRHALIACRELPDLAKHLANFLANTLFYTSDIALDAHRRKHQLGRFINPDLCKITEDLFFLDPYCDHERNSYNPLLADDVKALWADELLKAEVAELKYRFLNRAEALLHGDLHAGSVFVTKTSTQVIDPEFAYYGPIGFDVGSIIGNLLLNYCAQTQKEGDRELREAYQSFLKDAVVELWNRFAAQFCGLMAEHCVDPSLASPVWQARRMQAIFQDTVGFAGTELIRRTIGLAHVADLDQIENLENRAKAERLALTIGKRLVLESASIKSIEDLISQL
jgi:5-methylthioribose kinase